MRHPRVMAWEGVLKSVFDEIDNELEAEYSKSWSLHPARPEQGRTSNPEHDGLFNVGAAFSTGIGSTYGPGYTVEILISTLEQVPSELRARIKEQVFELLEKKIPDAFPGKRLQVSDDEGLIRIHGDLSLDS